METAELSKFMENALVNEGNTYRIKQCMKRAEAGEEITIGFLGGSITQGSLATEETKCYSYLVYQWWKDTFKNAKINYVNAGIGATNSYFGVARAEKDLLEYFPDFVIIDFSVNDDANEFFMETFEGVTRKITKNDDIAVVILNNVFYNTGQNAEAYHNKIAKAYGIPCISMKESLYQMLQEGIYQNRDITPDDLHPNDLGHQLVAETIMTYLTHVYENLNVSEEKNTYPGAVTDNTYEGACILQSTNYQAELSGFIADPSPKEGMRDLFKHGWYASKEGDSIHFEFEGSSAAVQYLKAVAHPLPVAEAVLDGDKEHKFVLDGNFDETWGDYLCLDNILHHGAHRKHTLDITIINAKEIIRPFYLVSLIIA